MSARRFDPPRMLAVDVGADGRPERFLWRGRTEWVATLEATWVEQDGWWRGPGGTTTRHCYRVRAASGLRCLLYRRGEVECWTLGAILD